MAKIFEDATILLVWEMITVEKLRLKEVAKQLDTTSDVVNKIYMAGYRRWGCNQHRREVEKNIEKKLQRPPAVYSNQSHQNTYE